MKRLLRKKASSDINVISEFILNAVGDWEELREDESLIEQIKNENPECVYSGEAYRILQLVDYDDYINADSIEFEWRYSEEEDVEYLSLEDSAKVVKDYIKTVAGKYFNTVSFAKTRAGIDNFYKSSLSEMAAMAGGYTIILKCNISNGFDLQKLYKKYENELKEIPDKYNALQVTGVDHFEEVLAPPPSDFEILDKPRIVNDGYVNIVDAVNSQYGKIKD